MTDEQKTQSAPACTKRSRGSRFVRASEPSVSRLEHADFPILRVDVKPGDHALFWSDVHAPIHDRGAMDIVCQAHEILQPRISIAGGDIVDTNGLSRHRKAAQQQLEHGSLIAEAETIRGEVERIERNSVYQIYLGGNHEGRVERLVDDVPALAGVLHWYTPFQSVFGNWETPELGAGVLLGPVLFVHGDGLAGSLAKYPAAAVLANYPGQCTVFGHCHKIDVATRPSLRYGRQTVHGAWTFGHLSDSSKQGYAAAFRHAWQLGFGHFEFWDRGDGKLGFIANPIRIFPTEGGGRVANFLGTTLTWRP